MRRTAGLVGVDGGGVEEGVDRGAQAGERGHGGGEVLGGEGGGEGRLGGVEGGEEGLLGVGLGEAGVGVEGVFDAVLLLLLGRGCWSARL